jgi:hypothetical protein
MPYPADADAGDATNHPGLYEFQFADARFSVANSRKLVISVCGATNLLNADYEIALVKFDPYDAMRLGLATLPNAAADAVGGLPISDAGGLDLDARLDAAVSTRATPAQVNTEADTAPADAGVTTARTGYLDKLNITGNVAGSSEVTAIQNNTRVRVIVPPSIEHRVGFLNVRVCDDAENALAVTPVVP